MLAGGLASDAVPWLCPAVDLSRSAGAALIAYWGKWLKWLESWPGHMTNLALIRIVLSNAFITPSSLRYHCIQTKVASSWWQTSRPFSSPCAPHAYPS